MVDLYGMVDFALSVAQISLIWAQLPDCWPVAGLYQLNLAGSVGIMNWRCEPHPLGLGMMPQDFSNIFHVLAGWL